MTTKEQTRMSLVRTMEGMGFPAEFGETVADVLGTEKQMFRMVSWLVQYKPGTVEEIADELISIKEEFQRYRNKKMSEYYNMKNNELMNKGLE